MFSRTRFLVLLLLMLGSATATYVLVPRFGQGARKGIGQEEFQKSPPKLAALLPSASPESQAGYQTIQVTPYGLPLYRFSLKMPRGWRWRPFDLSRTERSADNQRPIPMAEFGPKDPNDPTLIEARYVRVPQHVTLERFVSVYAEQSGFVLLGQQKGLIGGEPGVEAVLRARSDAHGPYYIRLSVLRRGERLFLLAGSALEKEYEKSQEILAMAAASFQPAR